MLEKTLAAQLSRLMPLYFNGILGSSVPCFGIDFIIAFSNQTELILSLGTTGIVFEARLLFNCFLEPRLGVSLYLLPFLACFYNSSF